MCTNKAFDKLRKCQQDALHTIDKYIKSDSKGTALIKMPTGTGKTGVIAYTTQILFNGSSIIIVPNSVLPEQIIAELSKDFWLKLGFEAPNDALIIPVSSAKSIEEADISNKNIWVITIQKLLSIFKAEKNVFERLISQCSLLIFDEGHREFADIWQLVVKQFSCKKILFTATPYRNDKKAFITDVNYEYKYSIVSSIQKEEILEPKFFPFNGTSPLQITELVHKLFSEKKREKILIRSSDSTVIENLVLALNKKDIIAAGFHSKFQNKNDKNLYNQGKHVYSLSNRYKILIHSDMLIEGIDLPELDTIIFLNTFRNMKSNIQQIGRALRKKNGKTDVHVYYPSNDLIKIQWDLYLKQENGDEHIDYVDGVFRNKFDFCDTFYKDVLLPKRAKIYLLNKENPEKLLCLIKSKIEERIDLTEFVEYKRELDANDFIWIMCYEKCTESKYLQQMHYKNKSLEMTVVYKVSDDIFNDVIFYFDTSNFALPLNQFSIKEFEPEQLYRLIPEDFEITESQSRLATQRSVGIKAQETNGEMLQSLPVDISQQLSICKSVSGKLFNTNKPYAIHRYLSPVTGKISDSELVKYTEYISWCKEILNTVKNRSENGYFKRFSNIVKTPPTTHATSILFFFGIIVYNTETSTDFYLESITSNIQGGKDFNIIIEGTSKDGKIQFKEDKIDSIIVEGIDNYIVSELNISLSDYINISNQYHVFFGKENIMYYNKQYFKPNISTHFNNIENWDMWSRIHSIKSLDDCIDEKFGDKSITTTWPPKSIFRTVIDGMSVRTTDFF